MVDDSMFFHIPSIPTVTKFEEPQPLKKAPVAGYDVKTLKRQVSYLETEMSERELLHRKIYTQNTELWQYIQDLISIASTNAVKMRDKVNHLLLDIKYLTDIRKELATKIQTARDSKAFMQQIYKSLGNVKFSAEEMTRLHEQAEQALTSAQNENSVLEETLKSKIKEMQALNWKIDESVNKENYDSLLEKARDYWYTNKIVLRSAFKKFEKNIGKDIRFKHFSNALQRVFHFHILRKYFDSYMAFMYRRSFMSCAIRRREHEAKQYSLMKLKFHMAMSIHIKKQRRKVLLKRTYKLWKEYTNESQYLKWAQHRIDNYKLLKFKQKYFYTWKKTVLFLDWNNNKNPFLDVIAHRQFLHSIFKNWKLAINQERKANRESHAPIFAHCNNMLVRRSFIEWKLICQRLWNRRGKLLIRFYKIMRRQCKLRLMYSNLHNTVRDFRLRLYWKTFHRHIVRRLRVRLALRFFVPAHYGSSRKKMLQSIQKLFLHNVVSKRHKASRIAAHDNYFYHNVGKYMRYWYKCTRRNCLKRKKTNGKILDHAMQSWSIYRSTQVISRNAAQISDNFRKDKSQLLKGGAFRWLMHYTKKTRRMAIIQESVKERHIHHNRQRWFVTWRCVWTSKLFRSCKEIRLESARIQAIQELKSSELNDLTKNREDLKVLCTEQEEKLTLIEAQRDEKENKLRDCLTALEHRSAEKKDLEIEMENVLRKLQEVERERTRLQLTEKILLERQQREKESLNASKIEAEKIILTLEEERKQLEEDVSIARQHAAAAESFMESRIHEDELSLEASRISALNISNELVDKRRQSEELKEDHESLKSSLREVQEKLVNIMNKETPVLLETESAVRNRTAVVRELSETYKLTEARNEEMNKIIRELEDKLRDMTIMTESEKKRMNETQSLDTSGMNISRFKIYEHSSPISSFDVSNTSFNYRYSNSQDDRLYED